MNYGKNLKTIRISKELSQDIVADKLGIKRSTYKEYELQNSIIPLKHLNSFSNIFNYSIDYLLELTNIEQYPNYKLQINNDDFNIRFKNFRKENKLTQKKLAIIINTTQSVIADYEKGRYLIATPFLYDICKKYNISADYLLGKIDYIPDWCNKDLKN